MNNACIDKCFCRECEPRRTIADLIMEKIGEKKTEIDTQCSEPGDMFK